MKKTPANKSAGVFRQLLFWNTIFSVVFKPESAELANPHTKGHVFCSSARNKGNLYFCQKAFPVGRKFDIGPLFGLPTSIVPGTAAGD